MDTLEDRGMDRRLADRGGHGADPSEAKAVTQRIKLNHCSSHRKQGSPRLELTSRLSWATLPGSSFRGLTEARCAPAPGAPPHVRSCPHWASVSLQLFGQVTFVSNSRPVGLGASWI